MSHLASGGAFTTYLNPVFPKSFPDPFVLKHDGKYYGYSTGFADDGNVFGVITSDDLVSWIDVGGAMKPLEDSRPFYWAPEVTYSNGKFYLYYSVGNETLMEIRVAVSDTPDGGFVDSGHRLTYEDFAIDAHVFIDDDGSKYLFYATDFLEHTHIGTGTVVDRMIDWFTLAGEPHPVTRAKYDWQVYDPHRLEKGGVRWHTVEGPTILKRKGTYFEMFSGGNWQNTTYGVSFAVTSDIRTRDEWIQFSDGDKVLPIVRTEPGLIVGPGHNSVVRGPNNRELYCVYHRWTDAGRVLAIDRMDFAGKRIFVVGASHTPQPAPYAPTENGHNELRLDDLPSSFLCEMNFRCGDSKHGNARDGFHFATGTEGLDLIFDPVANEVSLVGFGPDAKYACDPGFDWTAKHLLRIEVDGRRLNIKLDGAQLCAQRITDLVSSISVLSENAGLEVSSFEITEGFEELFEDPIPVESNGWMQTGDADKRVEAGELLIEAATALEMSKHRPLSRLEFAANFKVVADQRTGEFGLILRPGKNAELRFSIDLSTMSITVNTESAFKLPVQVALDEYHQLRIVKSDTQAFCYFDDILVQQLDVDDVPTTASVFCGQVSIAIEIIRLTAI